MKVCRLEYARRPWVPPTSLELAPDGEPAGIVVVVGRNASGKTTLARALAALVWTEAAPPDVEVEAELLVGGQRWYAARLRGVTSWRCEGERAEAPVRRAAHLERCYRIDLREVLAVVDAAGEPAVEAVRRELGGGIAPQALLERHFALRRPATSPWRALEQARARRLEAERAAGALAREADALAQLEAQLERAAQVAREERVALAALERLEALEHIEAADRALRALATGAARVSPEDLEAVERAEATAARFGAELEAARAERDAKLLLADALGSVGAPDEVEVEVYFDELRALVEQEGELRDVRHALGEARELEAIARGSLDGARQPADVQPPSLEELRELEALLREEDAYRAQAVALEAVVRRAQREAEPGDSGNNDAETPRAAEEGARALRSTVARWAEAAGLEPWRVALGAVLGAVAAVVGTRAADLPVWSVLLAIAGAAGLVAVVWGAWRRRAAQSQLAARGVSGERASLAELLERGAELEAQAARERAIAEWREAARRRLREAHDALAQLEAERAALRRRWAAWARRLGLDGAEDVSGLGLAEWARRLHAWREARERVAAAAAQCDALERELAERRARLVGELLRASHVVAEPSAENLRAALRRLREQLRHRAQVSTEIRTLDERIGRLERQVDAERKRAAEVYERAGLDVGDREALRRAAEAHAEYLRWVRERHQWEGRLAAAECALDDGPVEWMLERSSVERRLEAAREAARHLDSLRARVEQVRARIEAARGGSRIEDALRVQTQARDRVRAHLRAVLRRAAAEVLLERVEAGFARHVQPRIVEAAAAYLVEFTRGHYEVRFVPRAPFLAVWDARHERFVDWEALSDATRVHLLLAARLAYLDVQEGEGAECLPLVLDEALSTTDPHRLEAVVGALVRVASRGRQVFYLTSTPVDEERWREAIAGRVPWTVVSLDAERGEQAPSLLAPAPRPELPPAEAGAEAVARAVGVAPLDPWAPAGCADLFHVVGSGDLLLFRRLATAGVRTVGDWEALVRHSPQGAAALAGGEAAREALEARVACLRAWLDAVRGSVPRPLRPGAVPERVAGRYAQAIDQFVRDNPSAAALLAAVRARGGPFAGRRPRAAFVDSLEAWLTAEGYLVTAPTDAEEATVRRRAAAVGAARPPLSPQEAAALADAWERALLAPARGT